MAPMAGVARRRRPKRWRWWLVTTCGGVGSAIAGGEVVLKGLERGNTGVVEPAHETSRQLSGEWYVGDREPTRAHQAHASSHIHARPAILSPETCWGVYSCDWWDSQYGNDPDMCDAYEEYPNWDLAFDSSCDCSG